MTPAPASATDGAAEDARLGAMGRDQGLLAALGAAAAAHRNLTRLAEALCAALVRRDAKAVAEAAAAEEGAAAVLIEADARLRAALARLGRELELGSAAGPEDVVDALGSRGEVEASAVLAAAMRQLRHDAAVAAAANRRNVPLLRQAVAFTEFALRSLGLVAGGGTYDGGGRSQAGAGCRVIDARA